MTSTVYLLNDLMTSYITRHSILLHFLHNASEQHTTDIAIDQWRRHNASGKTESSTLQTLLLISGGVSAKDRHFEATACKQRFQVTHRVTFAVKVINTVMKHFKMCCFMLFLVLLGSVWRHSYDDVVNFVSPL